MKRLFASMMILGFVASLSALAKDKAATTTADQPVVEKAASAPVEKPAAEKIVKAGATALTEIAVTGKVSKEEPKAKGGKVKFVLTTADGAKITLPKTKTEVADLQKFVGKEVKVVGKGKETGKKIHLESIASIVEETAAAVE